MLIFLSDALIAFTDQCDDLPSLLPFVQVVMLMNKFFTNRLSWKYSQHYGLKPQSHFHFFGFEQFIFRKWRRNMSEKVLLSCFSSLCNIKISITRFQSNPGMDAIFHSFLSERGDPGNVSIGGGNSFGNPGGKRWDVLKIKSLLLMFPPLQCTNSGKEKVCRRCWAKRSSPRKLQKQLQMGGSTTSWTSFASIEQNLSCLKFSPPGTRCWLASSPPQRRLWRTPTANVQLNEKWSVDEFHNYFYVETWTVMFSIGFLFFAIQWYW